MAGLGAQMDFRMGGVVADCADRVTMALIWFVLLILYGPLEICASIVRSVRSVLSMTSRRPAGPGRLMSR
jgi:hypothetical protein